MTKRDHRRDAFDETGAEIISLYPNRRPAARPAAQSERERLLLTVDGEPVVVEATDELVLRCGAASITLRSNGRVLIQGTHVETRAEGVNRIKGGSVQIN
jgi:hypothetical protein